MPLIPISEVKPGDVVMSPGAPFKLWVEHVRGADIIATCECHRESMAWSFYEFPDGMVERVSENTAEQS